MRREELFHAIRAACAITGKHEVIVVGSQSILGTYAEDELPAEATISREIDVLPIDDDPRVVEELADAIEGVAGELSPFEQLHGFFMDGVDETTAVLPAGWRGRLVRVAGPATTLAGTSLENIGWCLSPEDLCVAKLCANRDKDRAFVGALLDAGLVDPETVAERLQTLEVEHDGARRRALSFLQRWLTGSPRQEG
ncbi:DUF6036 family nucleotidyltransferase [Actinomyces sp. MRS3W]|uniref:DUF6036 family nucleotidyltransferase n=1 Tax=Actinomyces sp. MRS3W TaxID=2800796 RepID=UPI0028FD535A|nr:DUF6036 family nucleotidyltransferase [Actinomyces sp. MRS3W]MDU0349371.1 DUF6036 family nucleotidyltransferase [Actinomyces sp. MRS3W]